MHKKPTKCRAGFSLLITLALLSLLTLLAVGLVALVRVEAQAAGNSEKIAQARANATLALRVAVAQLQRFTGAEGVVTARADAVGGTTANPNWTGVWNASDVGGAITWLVSGNEIDPLAVSPATSVAAPSSRSDDTVTLLQRTATFPATEIVRVRKSEIRTQLPNSSERVVTGRYAFWISDESLKVSLNVPPNEPPLDGYSRFPTPDLARVYPTLSADANARSKLIATEQVRLLPGAGTLTTFNSHWPYITAAAPRLHFSDIGGGKLIPGSFNANSARQQAWEAYLAPIGANAATLNAILAAPRPFRSIADFQSKLTALVGAEAASSVVEGTAPILGVRGDTFLVRAFGEAINPNRSSSEQDYVTAVAYCEALVQRTPVEVPGFGYRYAVVYFRWLGSDDI